MGAEVIRNFSHFDLGPLVAAWNAAAPLDPMDQDRFRDLILLDRNFDRAGLKIATDSAGQILGAAYAVRRRVAHDGDDLEPAQGWLPFFFVVPEFQGQGLGRRLLELSIGWLKEQGAHFANFSAYTPNYVLPGLDRECYPAAGELLDHLGFISLRQADAMQRSLAGYEVPTNIRSHQEKLEALGWQFSHPSDGVLVDLIELAYEFNSDWARGIREGILNGLSKERILTAIDPGGRLLGWAMHETYEQMTDRFGPFGVHPDSRGTGLGKVLFHLLLERMAAAGADRAWFMWADRDSVASHLYQGAGFSVMRTFDILQLKIS